MESQSVALAAGALMIGAVADLLYRVAQQRGIEAPNFVFWQSTIFSGLLWAVSVGSWLVFGGDGPIAFIHSSTWFYGVPAGIIAYAGLTLFVASLRTGDASVNAPIFRLNFVVTAIGAILILGESVTLLKTVGIVLAVLAVLVLLNITKITAIRTNVRSLLYAVVASVLFGIAGLISKAALDTGDIAAVPLILTQTVGFQQAAIITLMRTRHFSPNRVVVMFAPGIALLQIAWSVLLFESLRIGDASISYPIVQMSFVITAILAVIFLKEEMNWSKGGGLVIAIIAVIVLGLAG